MLTDYPDRELLENLEVNVKENVPLSLRDIVRVEGHVWGTDVEPLLNVVRREGENDAKFDLVILSDLIFNHSQVCSQLSGILQEEADNRSSTMHCSEPATSPCRVPRQT